MSSVKFDLLTEYKGRRSNDAAVGALTDGQTNGRYQVHYLPASLSYVVDNYPEDLSFGIIL